MGRDFEENKFAFSWMKDISLYYCGRRIRHMNHSYGPEIRTHFLIVYIAEGHGILKHRLGDIRLYPHQLLVMFPNERIEYKVDKGSPWTISWVGVYGSVVGQTLKRLGITPDTPTLDIHNPLRVQQILENIYQESFQQELQAKLTCIGYLYEFFASLFDEKEIPMEDYVQQAQNLITYNFDKAITVESVAEAVHVSPSYLSRIFKKELGISPKEYIIRQRIDRACELLSGSSASIKEIAVSVGIQDEAYFSRLFKKHMGISPGHYRNHKI